MTVSIQTVRILYGDNLETVNAFISNWGKVPMTFIHSPYE